MKISLCLVALLFAPLPALATTCVFEPLEQQLENASVAFIATILESRGPESFRGLQPGDEYRVSYRFEIQTELKGSSSAVPSLFTRNSYHPIDSDLSFDGDETRLLPGDNVLVMAKSPGESQVASCGPSRIWRPTSESLQTLRLRNSQL